MMDMSDFRGGRPHRRRGVSVIAAVTAGLFAVTSVADVSRGAAWAQTPPAAAPQTASAPAAEDRLSQAQLEQLLAPIALYPDELLMQVLIAATYPLEIVQAKRWLAQGQNAALKGDALVQALVGQSWDPSVKSLIPFPDVLGLMNEQLDWTQQVGDAVLGQQEDVLNAIQVLRARAQASGALQSGPQQTVTVTQNVTVAAAPGAVVPPPPQIIVIEPANPQQVFVPVYNPTVVFGTWPHVGYPPVFFPPPPAWGLGNALLTGMAFAGGVAVVGSLWGWARPGWGRGDVNIDVNRHNTINVNRTQITSNRWQHDTTHRGGVAYRNDQVRDRVGANRASGGADRVQAREQFRGRADQALQGGLGDRRPDATRPNLTDRLPGGDGVGSGVQRPGGGAITNRPTERPATQQRAAVQDRVSGRPQVQAPARTAPPALQGVGQGGRERAAAQRGEASRAGQSAARAQAQQRQVQRAPGGGGGGGARAAAPRGGGGIGGGGGLRR